VQNDRVASSRYAEQLVRDGRIDEGMAEYRRLLELQPRDWHSANLLGDLLAKREQTTEAIALFRRAAETLATEGFTARACALYKKILKLQPQSDDALIRAGELSAAQGLVADARVFFDSAASVRRRRGDERGALDVAVRIGALDPDDLDARLKAARARTELDDRAGAVRDLTDLGLYLLERERAADALTALREVVSLDRSNTTVAYLVELLEAGNSSAAMAFASDGAASDDEPLSLALLEASTAKAAPAEIPPVPEAPDGVHARIESTVSVTGETPPLVNPKPPASPSADIEQIFAQLRQDVGAGTADQVAQVAYTRGTALIDAGDVNGGIDQLKTAARSLRYRFAAGVRLAREHERRRQLADAIDWLGIALDAPADPIVERYDALLYLATLLEQQGETARALATCLELQADAGAYCDVDARIARLTREQAGG
jgi:tetratricopeptide (TPR) repeat protein